MVAVSIFYAYCRLKYIRGNSSDGSKLSDFSIGIGIGLLLTVVFFLMRLRTRIDDKGVHVRFFPFLWKEKTWRWEDIGDVYLKKYSPWEYGGWGYRFGKGGTTAFTTKGYYGIHFVVKKTVQLYLLVRRSQKRWRVY